MYSLWAACPLKNGKQIIPKNRYLTADLRCATSQKSGDLIYTAKEAGNHALYFLIGHSESILTFDFVHPQTLAASLNKS